MLFELGPDVFHRVQLRSVGWQIVDLDLPIQGFEVVVDYSAAVTRQPIPDQQHRAVKLFPEVLDKVQDFLFAHGSFVQPEVELPQGNTSGEGEIVPIELMLQDRRDAPLGPSADTVRTLTEAALVYEDDDPALFLGFFLSTGQIFSFQSRMANSFRSRARPAGRWQLQPSFFRRIHHTCPG